MTLILRQLFLFLGSFVSGEKTAKTEMTSPAKKPRTESSSKGLESSQYDIFFVTGNSQKLLEVNSFFQQNGVTIAVENVRLDLPEMQGECEEIGLEKVGGLISFFVCWLVLFSVLCGDPLFIPLPPPDKQFAILSSSAWIRT